MPKTQKESLFRLVKSLSKSEKRQFKLYVNRLESNTDKKFIALFDLLDKMSVYDEQKIANSKIVKREQLSNVKSHLYRQILVRRLGRLLILPRALTQKIGSVSVHTASG